MNRLKTFFYFIGTYLLTVIGVRVAFYVSNYLMDSIPDLLYVSILGAVIGYVPLYMATEVAFNTTNNEVRTRKIIWIFYIIVSISWIFIGLADIIISVNEGIPLFQFYEEIAVFSAPNHWIYELALGISMLFIVFQIKDNKRFD